MAHNRRRAVWWSTVAVGCTACALSARVVLPAQAVSLDIQRAVERSAGRDLETSHVDQGVTAAMPKGGQPMVAVSVPATAVVQVDSDGRVVAAMTNTGGPPRSGDDVWLMYPDGSMQPTSIARFADHAWIGDFTDTGVYVAQTA